MAFNLKSGNRPSFRKLGSNSYKPAGRSQTSTPLKSYSPLKQEASEGMDYLKEDLESEGYKKRLARELKLEGDKTLKTTPVEGDKYYTEVKDPTAEEIIAERRSRADKAVFHEPSEFDEDGRRIGYAHADHVDATTGGTIKPGSDIFYSDKYDWEGTQAKRKVNLDVHEGAHAITAGEHGMLGGTKDLLKSAKAGEGDTYTNKKGKKVMHNINRPQEVYARYKVSQKYLKEQGIFDAFSGDKFTNKNADEVNKMMKGVTAENYKEKGIPYEVFTFFGDDKQHPHGFNKKISKKDMKKIFNNVASNEPNLGKTTDDFGNQQDFA